MFSSKATRHTKYRSVQSASDPSSPPGRQKPQHEVASLNRTTLGASTPLPSRFSSAFRTSPSKVIEVGGEDVGSQPIHINNIPQDVKDELSNLQQNLIQCDAAVYGGMDKETCLSWCIFAGRLFIWNYLSPSTKCIILQLTPDSCNNDVSNTEWLISVINWDSFEHGGNTSSVSCISAGIVALHKRRRTITYWPDICGAAGAAVTSLLSIDDEAADSSESFNSLISCSMSTVHHEALLFACSSVGELWQINCSPCGVEYSKIHLGLSGISCNRHPRSLVWGFSPFFTESFVRQLLFLTDNGVHCFSVSVQHNISISKAWSHELHTNYFPDMDKVWVVDMQVDGIRELISLLVILCKDSLSSSSCMQYSILDLQCKKGLVTSHSHKILLPSARVETEDFLFSLRLRVGGGPQASAVVLSSEGKAIISYLNNNSTCIYHFYPPSDAGKVLDASVLSASDVGDNVWIFLTEKTGVWAVPNNMLLSHKEMTNHVFDTDVPPQLTATDKWKSDESELLLDHLLHDYLTFGQVGNAFEKLKKSGAFEVGGEMNVFTQKSKSIVDTLAKHWTTTRSFENAASSIISYQLVEKQQRHQKFLHFLASTKCHEELCIHQKYSLLLILEHGEKLAALIQLRELQNLPNHGQSSNVGLSFSAGETKSSSVLWYIIQLVGERARKNTILLMDRDNVDVFYSRVSALEELFHCTEKYLDYVIGEVHTLQDRIQRSCELSSTIVSIIQISVSYRKEHSMWYPQPEGLLPWSSQSVVRDGIWALAFFMLQLLNNASALHVPLQMELYTQLQILAEVILDSHAVAVTALAEKGDEQGSLLAEYCIRKDSLLGSLYQFVKHVVAGSNKHEKDALEKTLLSLLHVAKRHEEYSVMWNISSDLNDSSLLRNLMRESMGTERGFSYYVLKQLYANQQFAQLLRLGEEFHTDLGIFLKTHQSLLWLHELFLHQFSAASTTLHLCALSKDERAVSEFKEGSSPDTITLVDRKYLLNVSRIAAMAAGKDSDAIENVERIDSDLRLLKLQEEIIEALPSSGYDGKQLLQPEELIEICVQVQEPQFALWAFEVFSWTSSTFRASHKTLLAQCWTNAASQDKWAELYEDHLQRGWGDEETVELLSRTLLFQASSRCYAPGSETIDGGFDEVLSLRAEDPSQDSVESILMQHKDFHSAGKLMLVAITFGSMGEEDGHVIA